MFTLFPISSFFLFHVGEMVYEFIRVHQKYCISRFFLHKLKFHEFYILLKNIKDKVPLISFLKKQGISAFSHYSALHLSAYGQKHGLVYGGKVAEELGESLIRLPIFDTITEEAVEYVVKTLEAFVKR